MTNHRGTPEAITVRLPDTPDRRIALTDHPTVDQTLRFRCASGDLFGGRWTGVPVDRILDEATLPAETTHVLFESTDDYRVCVDISAALCGILALADADGRLESAPRFVSAEIDGTRALKQVGWVEPLALAPDESPEEYENFTELKVD